MNFGLRQTDLQEVRRALQEFPDIKKAVIFGSRAKGNYKTGSDVDLAIYGSRVSFDTIAQLHFLLNEEGSMPYTFDILWYEQLDNRELQEHIKRVGKPVYNAEDI